MILGYYEQSYFGGGRYIKISQKENLNYEIEWIYSEEPNYIPEAEKYIKDKKSILYSYEFCDFFNRKQLITLVKEEKDKEVNLLLDYINSINLKKMERHKFCDYNVDDGQNWYLFIELDGKKYDIKGYVKTPKKVFKILKYIEKIINDKSKDDDFDLYIDKLAKKIKEDLSLFQKILLLITKNSEIHHWGLGLYIRNNYIYNNEYLMDYEVDPDEVSDMIIKKLM